MSDDAAQSDSGFPRLLSVRETASVLRISVSRTYELIETGVLPAYRIGATNRRIRKKSASVLPEW